MMKIVKLTEIEYPQDSIRSFRIDKNLEYLYNSFQDRLSHRKNSQFILTQLSLKKKSTQI